MSLISQFLYPLASAKQNFLTAVTASLASVRGKAKKASSVTRNKGGNRRKPKHRGWKVQDGGYTTAGKSIATQLTLRWHPGLHVGLGRNGTLFAIEAGRVVVTCEKTNLNWDHSWVQRNYAGRENQVIYKKYFNIIPEKQHDRFKLVDLV